ncbi:hybrid sensor histidine kinase/response regulator [Geobacter sp. AOG1]|uniref:hybrid sensor histidine kinase/response regulator n=1 Tax=Geobacter sp. AOG1 TaxID=1566346 RepID=UPI001CC70E6A|nr:hybrid sensor histidine kinase/response regulator [Geobacter sp. AOG1]GFE56583.1 hybrid sensor histidine kinase/response regulator [Geobacter sp. AOG1]
MSSKYLDIFLREADEHLTSLQGGVLRLEKEPANKVLIHELLRNAHTLKGSARMLGFEGVSNVAHRLEDLLKEMEEGEREVDERAIDILLRGSDAMARLVDALAKGEPPSFVVEDFLAALDRGDVPEIAMQGPSCKEEDGFGDTVRARVKTLDSLVNLLGELIINKKRLESRVSSLKFLVRGDGGPPSLRELGQFQRELEDDVLYLDYLIQELHGEAMELRMLPLRTITDGFQRLVRDLARDQGKEVDLAIDGDGIELDRVLLESLKPMFLHMLTNAVDHGIELPDERKGHGKPGKATIRISARHEGDSVQILVRDDGRGMDPARIKQAALRRGVIDKEEAELLGDEESLYLTLRPGFSTSEIVTDVSGRGVGLDVVQKNLERVKGTLSLRSVVGACTEITLQLPLSLSVVEALLVACGGECYAVPVSYVLETIKVRSEDIVTVGGKEVVALRGTTVPLVSLSSLLGLPARKELLETGKVTAVVLKLREQLLACTVDRHLGSGEIVVKQLGAQMKRVTFVFGATILGDGDPALILSVPDLFAHAEGATTTGFRGAFAEQEAARVRGRILVVDDSITTRTMERSILVSHGYQVEVAVSGEDALEKVAGVQFDLVVSDVEMPGINGFELTRQLRVLDTYREVPIIIVSSLSRDEHKRQALEAGAQAYIVKGSFDQGTLLDTVESLIG